MKQSLAAMKFIYVIIKDHNPKIILQELQSELAQALTLRPFAINSKISKRNTF